MNYIASPLFIICLISALKLKNNFNLKISLKKLFKIKIKYLIEVEFEIIIDQFFLSFKHTRFFYYFVHPLYQQFLSDTEFINREKITYMLKNQVAYYFY